MRCAGTSSGPSHGARMDDCTLFVTSDNHVTFNFRKEGGLSKAVITVEGDPDILLDIAHQAIAAAQNLRARKKIRKRVKNGEL